MIRTPDSLRTQFGVSADAGRTRAVPRYLLAYKGRHKSKLLATIFSMIVKGALPCHRRPRKHLTPVSQEELAASCGLASRSTFTRRLGLFRPLEQNEPKRKTPRTIAGELVHRQRRIAKPNLYAFRLPEGRTDAGGADHYVSPELRDLLELPEFNALFADVESARGVKDIPLWVWDARTPITDTARLVMTYYFLCGLGSKHRDTGEMIGEIHPKQRTVAAALGISVTSVYNANQELEGLGGVIRVVQDDCRIEGGQKMRGPAKILYLPLRTMTHDQCVAEANRLLAAKAGLRDHSWWERAVAIHSALLRAWDGKEHLPGSFNKEFRRQLKDAGAPKHVRDDLAPRSD